MVGYSQGGMVPRWALRFWPDTRAIVHDMIGIAPSNHGTLDAIALCRQECPPADWQQAEGARFLHALNSGAETFAGIDYTVIFSRTDEVVVPNFDERVAARCTPGRERSRTSRSSSLPNTSPTTWRWEATTRLPTRWWSMPSPTPVSPTRHGFRRPCARSHSSPASTRPRSYRTTPAISQHIGRAQSSDPMVPAEPPLACLRVGGLQGQRAREPPRAGCPGRRGG